jgi:hypothetical protein
MVWAGRITGFHGTIYEGAAIVIEAALLFQILTTARNQEAYTGREGHVNAP